MILSVLKNGPKQMRLINFMYEMVYLCILIESLKLEC